MPQGAHKATILASCCCSPAFGTPRWPTSKIMRLHIKRIELHSLWPSWVGLAAGLPTKSSPYKFLVQIFCATCTSRCFNTSKKQIKAFQTNNLVIQNLEMLQLSKLSDVFKGIVLLLLLLWQCVTQDKTFNSLLVIFFSFS